MRRGKRQRGINNQFLITRFSMSSRGGSTGGSAELTVEASPSARLSVRLSSRRSLAERPKSRRTSEVSRRGPNGSREKQSITWELIIVLKTYLV